MGYSGLTQIKDKLQQPDLEALALDRAPYIQRLTNDFFQFYRNKYQIELSAIDDIAEKLAYLYFSISYEHIKPVIDDKTNRFKMASLMELIIVQEQVLIHPSNNERENRKLNALFGMTAALSLIDCMINNASQEFFCSTINVAVNDHVQKMLEDHQLWLETKRPDDLPVFINAQFYEMIELVHAIPIQLNGF